MRKTALALGLIFLIAFPEGSACRGENLSAENYLKKAEDFRAMIPVKAVREIELAEGYHEGLFLESGNIWICNGKGGRIWVTDLKTGEKVSEIEPPGTFTESVSSAPDGKYWVSDWDAKKIYLAAIKEAKMVPEREISLAPSNPAGIARVKSRIFVIIWSRGVTGTKYYLLEIDGKGTPLSKVRITGIKEPTQLAWDGEYLWISSWFSRRVYKVDVDKFEIKGYFRSLIPKTTGIAWDGSRMWVTGTDADLFQFEFLPPEKS